ncbi:MAG: protoporphyrinogen oxidase [Gemmatales bacterium]|nr:protoporphyrinogen oxidase [Gemmatales bacterium]MDW8174836.1 protoporphyrinogen oxidase [Gemmatales bacterium]
MLTTDIVIVGAGISGLSLAFRLHQMRPDWRLVILEASSRPGGTIWTEHEQGFVVEYGPNGFLANKTSTLQLLHDLNLDSELISANPTARYRYVFDGQQLHRLPSGLWSLLTFPLLSWSSKWAIVTERWRRRPAPADEESVQDFISRRTDTATGQLLGPLLVTGIYAGDATRLSMAACFPRIVEMERNCGSVTAGFVQAAGKRKHQARREGQPYVRGSQLFSLRTGLRSLIETLASRLQPFLVLNTPVRRIECASEASPPFRWKTLCDQGYFLSQQVVLTCPAYVQAELLRSLDVSLADTVAAIPYVPIAVIALGYATHQLGRHYKGFGYLALADAPTSLLGCQWCSSIFPYRAPPDHVLMRYMAGGSRQPSILDRSDKELVDIADQEARRLFNIRGSPVYARVLRWLRAIPQYVLGHLTRLQLIQEALQRFPGLYLAGNAYRGVSLNDCTEQAVLLSEKIVQEASWLQYQIPNVSP